MGATNPNAGGAPSGGGKGGMGMNRGPGGNAQNNPGGPQANYGMGMVRPMPHNPSMFGFSKLAQTYPAFGGGLNVSQPTTMPAPNLTPPPPPPRQVAPVAPAQPQFNSSGLPAGGLLSRLYGG